MVVKHTIYIKDDFHKEIEVKERLISGPKRFKKLINYIFQSFY